MHIYFFTPGSLKLEKKLDPVRVTSLVFPQIALDALFPQDAEDELVIAGLANGKIIVSSSHLSYLFDTLEK